MKLYSTLDRKVVEIVPIKEGHISMYNCGPTVYYPMHIGNIRAYVSWDILHRSLLYLGFKVTRVMNFTDVGHMTADEDFGEDKMELDAKESGKQPIDIANEYIKTILNDFSVLNLLSPSGEVVDVNWNLNDLKSHGWLRATDYVSEMIEDIKAIIDNGFAYETDQAVYFDITKIPDYTIFTGQSLDDKLIASRDEVKEDPDKKHPADFVLWMKRVGKYKNHIMNWSSPWGEGFPGWHIECSAMSIAALGKQFDIHTGGIDHLSVHHPNERAQNIGVCGEPVVKYWVHNEFIVTQDNSKLSKSLGNGLYMPEIYKLGFEALDLRYLYISSNYRTKLQFSEQALQGARNARLGLIKKLKSLAKDVSSEGVLLENYVQKFKEALEDNLNMSLAFAILNEMLKSKNKPEDILTTVYDFDKVLALDIRKSVGENSEDIPLEVNELLEMRKVARGNKDYDQSDILRDKIMELGYTVLDTSQGQKVEKI
jgi:cysteinyl-tRNA synthetase